VQCVWQPAGDVFAFAVSWRSTMDVLPVEIRQLGGAIDARDRCSCRAEDERGEITGTAKWSRSNGLLSLSDCLICLCAFKCFSGGKNYFNLKRKRLVINRVADINLVLVIFTEHIQTGLLLPVALYIWHVNFLQKNMMWCGKKTRFFYQFFPHFL
jgi:hypothetical protein